MTPTLQESPTAAPVLAGFQDWACRLDADTEEGVRKLRTSFRYARPDAGVPSDCAIRVELAERLEPLLRISRRGRPLPLLEKLVGPEWKYLRPLPGSGRPVWANLVLGVEPALEQLDDDLRILQPRYWLVYAHLAFHGLLLVERPVFTLHAAVCGVSGRAVVLLGPSRSGKSTLSWALHERGGDLHSDEWAVVRESDFRLYPIRRDPSLRPGGVEALGRAREDHGWQEGKPGDLKCVLPPREPAASCPPDRVSLFFLDGFAQEAAVSPIGGGEAVRRVVAAMGYRGPSLAVRLDLAAELIERYPSHRLVVGNPHATALLVAETARRDG